MLRVRDEARPRDVERRTDRKTEKEYPCALAVASGSHVFVLSTVRQYTVVGSACLGVMRDCGHVGARGRAVGARRWALPPAVSRIPVICESECAVCASALGQASTGDKVPVAGESRGVTRPVHVWPTGTLTIEPGRPGPLAIVRDSWAHGAYLEGRGLVWRTARVVMCCTPTRRQHHSEADIHLQTGRLSRVVPLITVS